MREAVLRLKEAGYEEFEEGKIYQPGDKVYQINRKKALLMSTFGKRPLEDGVRINVAHIDSPRLDLKPNRCMRRQRRHISRPIITAVSANTSGRRSRWRCTVL